MILLAIAAIYVACQMVVSQASSLTAVENALVWMWWGELLAIGFASLSLAVMAVSWTVVAFLSEGQERCEAIVELIASPFLICMHGILQTLYLSGIYCVDLGIDGGELVDRPMAIVGCVLYGIAILLGMKISRSK